MTLDQIVERLWLLASARIITRFDEPIRPTSLGKCGQQQRIGPAVHAAAQDIITMGYRIFHEANHTGY
jgi:hypothetical protein